MIENTVRVLNELLAADPKATNEFFHLGVTVNKEVCDHPTIQVRSDRTKLDSAQEASEGILRPLGLLNGLIQEGNRVVVMHMDASETTIVGFSAGTINKDRTVTADDLASGDEL